MEQNPTYINWRNLEELKAIYDKMTPEERREDTIQMYKDGIARIRRQLTNLSPTDEEQRAELLADLESEQRLLAKAESTQKE